MHGSYTPSLVVLSVLIAIGASYTALDLASRVTAASGRGRSMWLAGGSMALGVGIWSMHFVGMLSFQLPVAMVYDVPLVLLSMAVAIVAAALALWTVSRQALQLRALVRAGIAMGVAISGMHYIGMAAMRVDAQLRYTAGLFALSILIAITASLAALWLAFHFRSDNTRLGRWEKGGSAIVMGLAISGMHYTGMAAAQFTPLPAHAAHGQAGGMQGVHGTGLAITVTFGTAFILTLALASAMVDRHRRMVAVAREQERFLQNQEDRERRMQERSVELQSVFAAARGAANRARLQVNGQPDQDQA